MSEQPRDPSYVAKSVLIDAIGKENKHLEFCKPIVINSIGLVAFGLMHLNQRYNSGADTVIGCVSLAMMLGVDWIMQRSYHHNLKVIETLQDHLNSRE